MTELNRQNRFFLSIYFNSKQLTCDFSKNKIFPIIKLTFPSIHGVKRESAQSQLIYDSPEQSEE